MLASGLNQDPDISDWASLYARLMVDQGQANTALVVLERALPEIAQDNDYYALYAALLQREARHEEAIKNYKALLEHNPENGLWWMGLAISQDASMIQVMHTTLTIWPCKVNLLITNYANIYSSRSNGCLINTVYEYQNKDPAWRPSG